jgi:hypothetical protein
MPTSMPIATITGEINPPRKAPNTVAALTMNTTPASRTASRIISQASLPSLPFVALKAPEIVGVRPA